MKASTNDINENGQQKPWWLRTGKLESNFTLNKKTQVGYRLETQATMN